MTAKMKNNPSRNEHADHYVYAYRDKNGKIRYVGYGECPERAMSPNRSKAVRDFVAKDEYTLEIAGPYGSEETGKAVETALICLLDDGILLNSKKAPGEARFQFRPLGVPKSFSQRLTERPLERANFATIDKGEACPLLFVFISSLHFCDDEDPRRDYSLVEPPPDSNVLARIERWWQLGHYVKKWKMNVSQSPRVLVGVTGPHTRRIIIGAVAIDQKRWADAQPEKGGLYQVPTVKPLNLDAHGLRGRLVSPKANIKFGALPHQFFVILKRNHQIEGGQT